MPGNDATGDPAPIKVNISQTIFIGFGFLSAMIAWSFFNFKIPIILNGIKTTATEFTRVGLLGTGPAMEIVGGLIMTLDNIIAILLQPWFGSMSDRLESRWGRRTPFLLIGLPVAAGCFVVLPLTMLLGEIATVITLFIAVIFVFNLAMAFYRPAIMSLMPDKTPPQVRSKANSFISLMGGLGFVFGIIIPFLVGFIPGTAPVPATANDITTQDYFWQDFWGFALASGFMLACLLLFLARVRETPTGTGFLKFASKPIQFDVYTQRVVPDDAEADSVGITQEGKQKKHGFFDEWRIIVKDKDKSAFFILWTVFAYLFGFNAIEFSFGRYATSYLEITEGTASLLLAIMPAILIVFAIPAGYWAEKHGRLKVMKIGLVVMMAMTAGLIIVMPLLKANVPLGLGDLAPAMVLLSVAGIGYGLTHINALPVVWQLAPRDKIGAYTGVYYMISALGSILSPIFMSSIYALISAAGGDQWLALFPYFLGGLIVGFVLIMKVRRGDAEPLSREELARLRGMFAGGD